MTSSIDNVETASGYSKPCAQSKQAPMSRTNAGLSSTPNPASHMGRREPGSPSSQDWEGDLKANKVKTLAYVF